jgi:two-component system alkaline phosphatase synthesis response regulator PhoP
MEKPKIRQLIYEYGGIVLNTSKYEVTYKKKAHPLTAKEFKLLEYILANKGRVLSRDLLMNDVWSSDYFGTNRTVDVHVAHLRQKFEILSKSLISIKGLGYKLQEEPTKA